MGRMWAVRVSVLTTLLTTLTAMDFHGMEDNCILSFVVPRDKVKSSCDMEERVTRRLNAMETKVTLYKQHVQELQEQLSKERHLHQHRMEELHQRLARREEAWDAADPLVDKRLQGLEEELRKIWTMVTSPHPSSAKPTQSPGLAERPNGRGAAVDPLPAGRSREEQEKVITVLVKTVVHSEVRKLFDNYTHYVGRYVRDQALAFNQIMNMVPRPDDLTLHSNQLPPKWPHGARQAGEKGETPTTTPDPHQLPDRDAALLNQLEGIRNRLNSSVQPLADRAHDATSATANPASTVTASHSTTPPSSPNDPGKDSNALDIDSASGDVNDTTEGAEQAAAFTVAPLDNGAANSLPMPSGPDAESLSSSPAKSRMSYNADLNKLPGGGGGDSDSGAESSEDPASSNLSGWKESMVHDQSAGQWIQELLHSKLQEVVQQQVEELRSLVLKHSGTVDSKLHDTDLKVRQLEQRLGADIKHLSQVVSGVQLEMTSVSQGLQTVHSRLDKVEELEDTVTEIRKNISQEGGSRLLATLLDEQGKKVRKMERLTAIYKQSLEHYRNETKLEYRGLKERQEKESGMLRALHTDLWHNVTGHAAQLTLQLNRTATSQLDAIRHRMQVMEDSSLLQQIDLSNFERQMKSKTSKSERDLSRLSGEVDDLKQKSRGLQTNLDSALERQGKLVRDVKSAAIEMHHMQIEVQLNVLDDWVPYRFDYMKTRTDCFGDQYIRKSGFRVGRLVGVVLCTQNRYKIFLGQSLEDTFKNIGDDSGMGEDHCQFVNVRSMSKVRVSPFRTSTETEPGYVRTHWGQEPRPELLNIIRPSPAWYECGVSIP